MLVRTRPALLRDRLRPRYAEAVPGAHEALTAELSAPGPKTESMWGWSPGKRALEYLFRTGAVAARRRASDFARLYDLTERVIPHGDPTCCRSCWATAWSRAST